MTKQECIDELRALLERLEAIQKDHNITAIHARVRHLCDLLDAYEHEGR